VTTPPAPDTARDGVQDADQDSDQDSDRDADRDSVLVGPEEAVPAAPVPRGAPPGAAVALLLCVALVGLGVVALREVLVGRELPGLGSVPGEAWLAPSLTGATSLVQGWGAVLVGATGLVLGGLLVAAAVAGRPARGIRLVGRHRLDVPLDLDQRGVAALAADAALKDPEVLMSRARAGPRRVVVDVSVDPRDPHDESSLSAGLTSLVEDRLGDLEPCPRVQVRMHGAVPR
jgi:hypothetical protein